MPDRNVDEMPAAARRRALLGLLVVCLGTIAAPLDSAVNIAFPSITQRFGLAVTDIRWIAIVYVLTYASLLLIFGRLGDLVGHRIVFQIGLLTATLGFAGCAAASSYELLLGARVLQGIGIALTLSCAPALATSLYDERERTRILGIYAAMTALGGVIGPLAGGLLVERFGWSAVFWARIPLVAGALALSWTIPPRPGQGSSSGLDLVGSVQLAVAMCGLIGGLVIKAPVAGPLGWLLPLGLIGIGGISLVAFVQRQSRHASPIIRPALFRDPPFTLMNIASVVANFATFGVVLIVPFYLVGIVRLETSVAGVVLSLAALGTIAGSALAPGVIARLGGMATAATGMLLSSAGLLGIAMWSLHTPIAPMVPALLLQGFGMGLFLVAYTDLVTATLPVAERGVAGSLTMLTRSIGIITGAAGLSALHGMFEAASRSDNATPIDAFMAGFQAALAGAAVLQLAALGIGFAMLRSRGQVHRN